MVSHTELAVQAFIQKAGTHITQFCTPKSHTGLPEQTLSSLCGLQVSLEKLGPRRALEDWSSNLLILWAGDRPKEGTNGETSQIPCVHGPREFPGPGSRKKMEWSLGAHHQCEQVLSWLS
jgi:hypothetical protein